METNDYFLVLKDTLKNLFKPYRPILPIIAHKNVRMRGQAFISFPDLETANKARKDVDEFPLYGKAMVSLLYPCFLSPDCSDPCFALTIYCLTVHPPFSQAYSVDLHSLFHYVTSDCVLNILFEVVKS